MTKQVILLNFLMQLRIIQKTHMIYGNF